MTVEITIYKIGAAIFQSAETIGIEVRLAERTLDPFISHTLVLPLVLRQRISALPSPLKSPVPEIFQLLSTTE